MHAQENYFILMGELVEGGANMSPMREGVNDHLTVVDDPELQRPLVILTGRGNWSLRSYITIDNGHDCLTIGEFRKELRKANALKVAFNLQNGLSCCSLKRDCKLLTSKPKPGLDIQDKLMCQFFKEMQAAGVDEFVLTATKDERDETQ